MYLIKRIIASFIILILIIIIWVPGFTSIHRISDYDPFNPLRYTSIIISDDNPYFGIIGSSYACRYRNDSSDIFYPLLVAKNNHCTQKQNRFLQGYHKNPITLLFGSVENVTGECISFSADPATLSLDIAAQVYQTSSSVLILPVGSAQDYKLSLIACPLASYLDIPVLLYQNNSAGIQSVLNKLQVSTIYVVGNINEPWSVPNQIHLRTIEEIHHNQLIVLKQRFQKINYLTLTNPVDVQPRIVENTEKIYINKYLSHLGVTGLGKSITISGTDTVEFNISIPDGVNSVQVQARLLDDRSLFRHLSLIDPVISLKIRDPLNNVASYALSPAVDRYSVNAESLTCDRPGEYSVYLHVYHGLRGGFFSIRGFSHVDALLNISITIQRMSSTHYPLIPKLSLLAPYLTSTHGGIIIANESFALTSEGYDKYACNTSTGPWYDESLHSFNNHKVNQTIQHLTDVLTLMEQHQILSSYLDGPAWMAILGDTNMIPMYYYGPSQRNIPEKGLPSDNPYSLNHMLSTGRVIAPSVSDTSLLICRTLFYQEICGEPIQGDEWFSSFHFVFGEGFGETGGFFHQIPYASEITEYGFDPTVYGNLRNSRQAAERLAIYSQATYIEYLGHGDWFWFTPSLYGVDMYHQAIDVATMSGWLFDRPNVFLSSACLMGRVDGVAADMNIGLSILSAGANAFIGATRETGQEAGLELLENGLIVDNLSMGEALRLEKRNDKQAPTYLVRTLYGDPAFNPYEPNNGFSNQGRPVN